MVTPFLEILFSLPGLNLGKEANLYLKNGLGGFLSLFFYSWYTSLSILPFYARDFVQAWNCAGLRRGLLFQDRHKNLPLGQWHWHSHAFPHLPTCLWGQLQVQVARVSFLIYFTPPQRISLTFLKIPTSSYMLCLSFLSRISRYFIVGGFHMTVYLFTL